MNLLFSMRRLGSQSLAWRVPPEEGAREGRVGEVQKVDSFAYFFGPLLGLPVGTHYITNVDCRLLIHNTPT